ncbi:MAG TPA: polysaccharide biosynthesis tyrosine autokinase [Geobacteraceae bacterium]|nr:polysaccharide biosynthesis tyrosine autokinase [Geobacteraceae bacterium]
MNQPLLPPPGYRPYQEEIHLQDYISVILRRRSTFLTAFVAVFLGVALFSFIKKPLYEADATLHVKDEKGKMGMMQDLLLNSANPVDSELEILKSRTNAENVVKQLHLDWKISGRDNGLKFRILEFSSTAKKPKYTVKLTSASGYTVTDSNGDSVGSGVSGQLLQGKGITLLLSDISGKDGDDFNLEQLPFNKTVENLRKKIKAAEVGKKTNIISIKYRDENPELARDVVNTLVQVYLDRTVAFKSEEASRAVGFIENQLSSVREDLDGAEKNLQVYKSTSRVVQLDAEAQNLIKQLADTERQKAEITLQKKQLEFALASLKESRRRGINYTPAVMREDPLVNSLAAKLAELEMQKRALLAENTDSHPSVKVVQGQIDELIRKLQATYETGINSMSKQEANVGQNLAHYENMLTKLPEAERDLARLMRLSKVNADIYTYLLQKHEEARIAKASTISNIHIVDPANLPDAPVAPKKKKNLLLGLLVGLMVGIGLAFFQEYLDDTIKDADEAKKVLGLPLLALIPFISTRIETDGREADAALVSYNEPKSSVAEAFRSLRTGIHFCAINRLKKVLLVTSSFPGEGKSTIAANLAITFAHTGARVLLVDCDMRRPSLHDKFGHSKTPGLTELLAGDTQIVNAIHNCGIPGLDMISSGTIPPNPAELLGSEAMKLFLERQREQYDHIVIDAPPVLAVTDATVLTSYSDLVLVVLETGRVPQKAANRLRELLSTIQTPIAGLVVSDRANLGSAYGYNYGYGYGYDYYQNKSQGEEKSWWQRILKNGKA